MAVDAYAYVPHPALVSRPGAPASYLMLTPAGRADWTLNPRGATPFASMREATRAALRLPSHLRAYGLPLEPEIAIDRLH